jgi:alpha-amylase/alpha-mannosidase (GH57 family)
MAGSLSVNIGILGQYRDVWHHHNPTWHGDFPDFSSDHCGNQDINWCRRHPANCTEEQQSLYGETFFPAIEFP